MQDCIRSCLFPKLYQFIKQIKKVRHTTQALDYITWMGLPFVIYDYSKMKCKLGWT